MTGDDRLRDCFELILHGADGSQWPIHGPRAVGQPVRIMEGEIKEFYQMPFESRYKPLVGVDGSSYRGHRYLAAHIPLRLDFFGEGWDEFRDRFRTVLAPDRDATLEAISRRGTRRTLTIRESEGPEVLNEHDAFASGAERVQFMVIAPKSAWVSETITAEWEFDGRNVLGTVMVDNPGGAEVWPEWVLTAPGGWILPDVDAQFPLLGDEKPRMVPIQELPAGRDVVVRTGPQEMTVEAVDRTLAPLAALAGAHFMHPIPPRTHGLELPVSIDPMPGLSLNLPFEWKVYLVNRLQDEIDMLPAGGTLSPDRVGELVAGWIRSATPSWVPQIGGGLVARITARFVSDRIRAHYGNGFESLAGAMCQIRITPRWRSPW